MKLKGAVLRRCYVHYLHEGGHVIGLLVITQKKSNENTRRAEASPDSEVIEVDLHPGIILGELFTAVRGTN